MAAEPQNTAPLTEGLLTAQEQSAEQDAFRVLEMTQRATDWERLVADFKRSNASAKITSHSSFNFLKWAYGAYRLQVVGVEVFRWDEVQDGRPITKATPCLQVKVLDGDTRAAKECVGTTYRASIHWGMGRAILDHIGMPEERAVMSTILQLIEETPDLVTDRLQSILAYVRCDADGMPLKQDTNKGRRVLADAQTICAG
jgi:hypothetical protein